EDENQSTTPNPAFHHFERVNVYLDLFALIRRVKVRWRMVAIEHSNDDSVKAAQFGHCSAGLLANEFQAMPVETSFYHTIEQVWKINCSGIGERLRRRCTGDIAN